ncbi:MAG: CcoQ/FixQ family Cbb3-type cytochrome c oxidase assembly chaperone [Verrucomicrobia bacterium]|nr:CcoQ/FixQ family Cbb3-type cytochrome c oxidase assembly chaperone [Verrucomicrobiota bacterium]
MIQNVLSGIGGVGMYGVISICLFFAFFIGVLVWTLGLKKSYLNRMGELPLDGSSVPESDADLTANPKDRHD